MLQETPLIQYLNAWCELSSPSQQVGEGQARTAKLLVEPHAEVVQRHSRCQPSPQPTQLVGPLPPGPEGVEQLVVDRLHYLADAGQPPPESLGPGFARVALGRVDDSRPIAIEPAPVILFAFEALE
jgi:hypothetical protein